MHQIKNHNPHTIHTISLENGIKIQQEQVETWSQILNNDSIIILKLKCYIENTILEKNQCTDGFKVFRGYKIDTFLQKLAIALQNSSGTELDKFLQTHIINLENN
ncbi:MAG: hypothetical protein ACOVNU_08050 [Candidatus Kapaibacteriota bacterium]